MQVLTLHAKCQADGLELVRARGILTTCHSGSQIVADDHGDVGMVIHGIQQSCHTRVREGRVAYHSDGRMLTGIGSTFGHGDAGAHIHTTVDGLEWRQRSQRVATYISEDASIWELGSHFIQGRIDIAMSAALTKLWRTTCQILGSLES